MFIRFTFVWLAILIVCPLFSQQLSPGIPASLDPQFSQIFTQQKLETTEVAPPDYQKIQAETNCENCFSAATFVQLSTQHFGKTTVLPDGRTVWRAKIHSPAAQSLLIFFEKFQLPAGAQFFAYDEKQSEVLGAFTEKSCRPDGFMMVGPLSGSTCFLEYILPVGQVASVDNSLLINRIDYGYATVAADPAFGTSLNCHANVNCQVASNFFREKKSVARIITVYATQTGYCTGALIANTAGTPEPYFLTAEHCATIANGPKYAEWRFDFGYQSPGCQNPSSAPSYTSILGCQLIAKNSQTDFMLLKLNPLPQNFDVYFNGWDRSDKTPANTSFIHHPRGDIKKFSSDSKPAVIYGQSINWGGNIISQPNTHFDVRMDVGTYESGSSGCPLFDENFRIVGQLHGGIAPNPCFPQNTFFGRLHLAWNGGSAPNQRLRDWLDPQNIGSMTQDGYFPPFISEFQVSGRVTTAWGLPIPNVKVTMIDNEGVVKEQLTNNNGEYIFEKTPGGKTYTLTAFKDGNDLNGISSSDLLDISRHLLGVTFMDSAWKVLAADANGSDNLSSSDILDIRRVLLGVNPELPVNSWKFYPAGYIFNNPLNPFPAPPQQIVLTNIDEPKININFFGVKMGDTNQSSDPAK